MGSALVLDFSGHLGAFRGRYWPRRLAAAQQQRRFRFFTAEFCRLHACRTLDVHNSSCYVLVYPRSLRASSRDAWLTEWGMRRLQATLVTSSQGAQSPSAPDE